MSFIKGLKRVGRIAAPWVNPIGAARDTAGLFSGSGSNPVSEVVDSVKSGTSSAWDVLSGERDWRRSQAAAKEAREWTADREDTAIQRRFADLASAGINPMMAGEVGGASSSPSPVPTSHSAQSWSSTLGLAGSLVSGGVNAFKGVAESGLIRANTARSLAETARTLKSTDPEIARTVAATVLDQTRVPNVLADTALKVAHKDQTIVRTDQMRKQMPRFEAEKQYFKRYGINAVLADKNKNPWQSSQLMAGQTGKAITGLVNSANSLLSRNKQSVLRSKRGRAR